MPTNRDTAAPAYAHIRNACATMALVIVAPASPFEPDILQLLTEHLRDMHAESPPESVHALAADALAQPHVTLLAAREADGELLGVGAIAQIGPQHGEIKSMRTVSEHRGRGIAGTILTALLQLAVARGFERVSLETGSADFFAPARRLYERHGFVPCGPFDDYWDDPESAFFTLEIAAA